MASTSFFDDTLSLNASECGPGTYVNVALLVGSNRVMTYRNEGFMGCFRTNGHASSGKHIIYLCLPDSSFMTSGSADRIVMQSLKDKSQSYQKLNAANIFSSIDMNHYVKANAAYLNLFNHRLSSVD